MTRLYPWHLLQRLPQSFLIARDNRTRSFAQTWPDSKISRACHNWLEDVFTGHVSPRDWAGLDTDTQVRVMAELCEVCRRAEEGKVFSPDDLRDDPDSP
ncbi:hypothetical protein JCM10213_004574 [Rhodosporidiobolus nylandii]